MPKADKHATTRPKTAERGVWRSETEQALHELGSLTGLLEHLGTSEIEVTSDDLGAIEAGLTRAIDSVEALLKTAPEGQGSAT